MENKCDDIDPDIFIRYYSSLKAIARDHPVSVPNLNYLPGLWIHGPTGTGKSSLARKFYSPHYLKNINKWWDGYRGEPYVIIDDWDPNHSMLSYHLKIWTDHYPFTAEIKGGARLVRPLWIIVTSQYSIDDCFDCETATALNRRFIKFHLRYTISQIISHRLRTHNQPICNCSVHSVRDIYMAISCTTTIVVELNSLEYLIIYTCCSDSILSGG